VRLVFLGTPDAAVPPLRALVDAGHQVLTVVSRADKRRGRGSELSPSPVKSAAIELGLTVTSKVDDTLGLDAELGVVVAFGQIIKPHVLDALPMVNLHFSLLPRWRGAAPVERAILAGDAETGVCVMEVEEGLDTGGVYASVRTPIGPEETAEQLRGRLVADGTRLLIDTLARPGGLGPAVPQEGEPTYAAKMTVDDLRLDWDRRAEELARLPRVGKAWTTFRGKRLLVLSARAVACDAGRGELAAAGGAVVGTGDGGLELLEVQPEGKGPMPAAAWRNGARPRPGERLGD
jgi:methionyl-tRNA formyltransferase